jgi:hypothetical protein
MLLDAGMKLARARVSVEATIGLGYPETMVFGLGALLLISTLLYALPQTSVLGAIVLTGYLGGAVASNLRIGTPLFSNVLFPVYVAVMVWGGLYLREPRLRALVPFRGSI